MLEIVKRIVLRLFPELSAGLHLDRYARVLAVQDAPEHGGTCERFRPRYAVDVQILTPAGEPDPEYPIYEAVPVPVGMGNGMESGSFAYPEAGSLVVLGFAYGRPDHPLVRQVYPLGGQLPFLRAQEQKWQQDATVLQRIDPDGNWYRETNMTIQDQAVRHVEIAMEHQAEYAREKRQIAEHSTEEIGGSKSIETLGNLRLLSAGFANISSGDNLNLTSARDRNLIVGKDRNEITRRDHYSRVQRHRRETVDGCLTEAVGADRTETVDGDHCVTINGQAKETVGTGKIITTPIYRITAQSVYLGSDSISILGLLSSFMEETRQCFQAIASHTHSAIETVPHEQETIATHGNDIGNIRNELDSISG